MNNRVVPVLTQYFPEDKTPCITFNTGEGEPPKDRYGFKKETLPPDHPYYDPNAPGETYVTQSNHQRILNRIVSINIWANDVDGRDYIHKKTMECLENALDCQYQYCAKLGENNTCSEIDDECAARTTINMYSYQGRCPFPDDLKPVTIFQKHNLIRGSVKFLNPIYMDDTTAKDILFKAVIRVDAAVVEDNLKPTPPLCNSESGEDIIL